jgi:hypothetical protein
MFMMSWGSIIGSECAAKNITLHDMDSASGETVKQQLQLEMLLSTEGLWRCLTAVGAAANSGDVDVKTEAAAAAAAKPAPLSTVGDAWRTDETDGGSSSSSSAAGYSSVQQVQWGYLLQLQSSERWAAALEVLWGVIQTAL